METKVKPNRGIIKQLLPYAGMPFICGALFLIRAGDKDAVILLRYELIIMIGYIAAILDLKTKRIPNGLVLVMHAAWGITSAMKLFTDTDAAVRLLIDSAFGFITGGGLFLLVYLISHKGLGGGDVKFMAASGAYLGFAGTITVLLYGSVLAALTGLALILLKKIGRKDSVPLAPFLYIGMLAAIFL